MVCMDFTINLLAAACLIIGAGVVIDLVRGRSIKTTWIRS